MKVQYYPLIISKKVKEASGSYSFYFQVPDEYKKQFQYRPAQFLTFKFEINGKVYVRSYSLSSTPVLGESLQTTVKRMSGGYVSNYMIDSINEGDEILSQMPLGEFFTPPKDLESKEYVLFAAGIGITPLFSILKTVLETSTKDCVRLIYSNRERGDIIYQKEIEKWKSRHPSRLDIQWMISKEERRLDNSKLAEIFSSLPVSKSLFYLCGPKDYMNMIRMFFSDKGVPVSKIRVENFNTVPILGPTPDENSLIVSAREFEEGEPEKLKAVIDNEELEIDMHRETPLLEQLLEAGHNVPFSCASGACMTCLATLKQGKIFQMEEGVLDEENVKSKEILTCQAYPLSKKVFVDYDDI